MPRRRRKFILKEELGSPRVTRRLAKELSMSQNNQVRNEIRDASLAIEIEIDSNSATNTKQSREELTENATQTMAELNNNYCIQTDDLLSKKQKEINLMQDVMMTRKTKALTPRNTMNNHTAGENQNIQDRLDGTSNSTELIKDNSVSNAGTTSSVTSVKTDFLNTLSPKLIKVKKLKKLTKLGTTLQDDYPTNFISRTAKMVENLDEENNILQEKLNKVELIEMNNYSERQNNEVEKMNETEFDNDPNFSIVQKIVEPIESLAAMDDNVMCKEEDTSLPSCGEIKTVIETIETQTHLICKLEPSVEEQLIKSDRETHDICLAAEEIDTERDMAGQNFTEILTSKLVEEFLEPKKNELQGIEGKTSSDNLLEVDAFTQTVQLENNQVLEIQKTVKCNADVKSETTESTHHPEPLTNTISDPVLSKCKRGRRQKKFPSSYSGKLNVESNSSRLIIKEQADTPAKMTTPKDKRLRKSRVNISNNLISLQAEDVNSELKNNGIILVNESQTSLKSEQLKKKRVGRRCVKVLEKPEASDSTEGISQCLESKSDDKLLSTQMKTNLISETVKPIIKRVRKRRSKVPVDVLSFDNAIDSPLDTLVDVENSTHMMLPRLQDVEPKISSVAAETERINIDDVDGAENSLSKNHYPSCFFSNTVNGDPLFGKIYQPRVLLEDLFYSNKLSSEQRQMIFKRRKYQANSNLDNLSDSAVQEETREKSKEHDKTKTLLKFYKETTNEKSEPEKNKAAEKGVTKSPPEVSPPKKWRKTSPKKLIKSEYNSSTETNYDIEMFSIQHVSTHDNDFGNWFNTRKVESLGMSIRTSEQSTLDDNADERVGEICSGESINDNALCSSVFRVAHLSGTFTKIDDVSTEPAGDADTLIETLVHNEFGDEKIMVYKAPESAKDVCPTTVTTSSILTEKIKCKTSISTDEPSVKVSIPAKYYFSGCDKLEKVITEENTVDKNTQTKLYTDCDLDEIRYLANADKISQIPNQEPSKKYSSTAELETFIENSSDKQVESTMSQSNTRNSDVADSKTLNTRTKHDPDVTAAVYESILSTSTSNPIMTTARSLPRIVTDELLPKGTITFTPICEQLDILQTADQSDSKNMNETDVDEEESERKIEKQTVQSVISIGDIDDLEKSKLCSSSCTRTRHHSTSSANIFDYTGIHTVEYPQVEHNFDSKQLWEICPELATYFGHESVLDNDVENVANIDILNNVKTNYNNNVFQKVITPDKETVSDTQDANEALSTDIEHVTESTANPHSNTMKEVIAAKPDLEKIKTEPIISEDISNSITTKNAVLADLTRNNLKNFNNLANYNHEGGLNWSVETCEYYPSHRDLANSSDKTLPDVIVKVDYESKKSVENISCRKRKRKWLQEEKDIKPLTSTRLRLNRKRWSNDGQDFENATHLRRQTSLESITSDNTFIMSNFIDSILSSQKTSDIESKMYETTDMQPNLPEEETESGKDRFNSEIEGLDHKVIDCTETSETKTDLARIIDPTAKIDDTAKESFDDTVSYRGNGGLDQNGNFTSSSSSSSSSSHSTESISDHKTESNDNKCGEIEEDEDFDEDCISLFAESIFTNCDQESDVINEHNMSTLVTGLEESDQKFQDMVDVGRYFEKNIQECNEVYESCMLEDNSMHDTSENIPQISFNKNPDQISMKTEININQLNPDNQNFKQICLPVVNLNKDIFRSKRKISYIVSPQIENLFRRQCFRKLRTGFCPRSECHFVHYLPTSLQNLHQHPPTQINEVIDYAISEKYNYFITHIYLQIVNKLDYFSIMTLFYKLVDAHLMTEHVVEFTYFAVKRLHVNLAKFVTDISSQFDEFDNDLAELIFRTLNKRVELGFFWETFRNLLIRIKPLPHNTNLIIHECIQYDKEKIHIEDVYVNYIRKLTADEVSCISNNLRRNFDLLLLKNNVIHETEHSHQMNRFLATVSTTDDCRIDGIPLILSPDGTINPNFDNLSHFSTRSKEASLNSTSLEPCALQVQSQSTPSKDVSIINQNLFNETNVTAAEDKYREKQLLTDLIIDDTSDCDAVNSSNVIWKLHPIDDLGPPSSVYHDSHWMVHLAMHNLKEVLKHKRYTGALKLLNKFSNRNKTVYISSCYHMLRRQVMESSIHVKNMIKLSGNEHFQE